MRGLKVCYYFLSFNRRLIDLLFKILDLSKCIFITQDRLYYEVEL